MHSRTLRPSLEALGRLPGLWAPPKGSAPPWRLYPLPYGLWAPPWRLWATPKGSGPLPEGSGPLPRALGPSLEALPPPPHEGSGPLPWGLGPSQGQCLLRKLWLCEDCLVPSHSSHLQVHPNRCLASTHDYLREPGHYSTKKATFPCLNGHAKHKYQ